MAEATLAPVEETPTLVTQETPPENATPVGDADPQGVADAAPAPSSDDIPDLDADVKAYMAKPDGKEGEQRAPEPTQQQGVDPAVAAEALRRFRDGYGTRQQRLDALGKRLEDAGYSKLEADAIAKEAKDILNEHHADSLQYAGYEAVVQEKTQIMQGLTRGLSKPVLDRLVAKAPQGKPMPYDQMFKAAYELGVEDGDEKGYARGKEKGFVDGNRHYASKSSSANSGQRVQGDPTGRSFSSEDALHTAWNNKDISRDVYAREYKRLTGRDL